MVVILMLPWILGFLLLDAIPMIVSFYDSFTKFNILNPPKWVGFKNYIEIFTSDPLFWLALRNTLWWILFSILARLLLAITTAAILAKNRGNMKIFRTFFFLPAMIPTVAATIIFAFILNPVYGPINSFLHFIGVKNPPLWFYDPHWSKWGLLILSTWGIGDSMIIFLAGFLDLPDQLEQVAELDGVSAWKRFIHIKIPLLTPVIFFTIITGVFQGFQYFTQGFVISSESTDSSNSMYFLNTHIYIMGFKYFYMGYASALGWILMCLTLVITILLFKTQNKWVYYHNQGKKL